MTVRACASPAKASRAWAARASGDLYLRVRLALHPVFERKGRDLYVKVPLPVTTAVLGGEADVQTLAGKPARLRIPPLTQNGQVFRLKGFGMPAVGKANEKGDLYARVEVQLPTQLSPGGTRALRSAREAERRRREHTARRNAMNINRLTEKAQEAVVTAQNLATEHNHAEVTPEHLLVALVEQSGGIVPSILRKLNVDPGRFSGDARALLTSLPQAYGAELRLSPRMNLIFTSAEAEAKRLQDEFISTEHLLLALATEAGPLPRRTAPAAQSGRRRTRSTRR